MPHLPKTAWVAFVCEAPGADEERLGRVLVGRSGELLNAILREVGLDRETDVILVNTVQCRPPNNKLDRVEVNCCAPIMMNILDQYKGQLKVVIPMGNTALGKLMGYGGAKSAGISKHRGRLIKTQWGLMVPTYHPAFALRNPANTQIIINDIRTALDMARGKYDVLRTEKSYRIITDFEEAMRELRRLQGLPAWAYDTEATDVTPDAWCVGISFCAKPGDACYIPLWSWSPASGWVRPSMIERHVFARKLYAEIAATLTSPARKAGHNLKFDAQLCQRAFSVWPTNHVLDTMLAEHTLDSEVGGFGLDILTSRYLPHMAGYKSEMYNATGVGKRKADDEEIAFGKQSLGVLGPYACGDADATLQLALRHRALLNKQPKLTGLYNDIVMPTMEALARAEHTGITIDKSHLVKTAIKLREDADRVTRVILEVAGRYGWHEFNPDSGQQTQRLLYESMAVKPLTKHARSSEILRTPGGQLPTDKQTLITIALKPNTSDDARTIVGALLEYAQVKKIDSTYITGMLGKHYNWVLHPSFLQHGTRTGRLSCAKPNLQNIPRSADDNPYAGLVKQMFIPRPGCVFISSDLSQIELRVLAYYTRDPLMLSSYLTGADLHKGTASEIFRVPVDVVTKDQRNIGKTVNFSVMYMVGPDTLYGTIVFGDTRLDRVAEMAAKYTVEDCASFIDSYFRRFRAVRPWMQDVVQFAREHGYVETYFGRKRRILGINDTDDGVRKHAENQAINSGIQGTAGDITNRAFSRCHRELDSRIAYPLLNVHDNIVVECQERYADEVAQQVLSIMTDGCGDLGTVVPIKADCAILDRLGAKPLRVAA